MDLFFIDSIKGIDEMNPGLRTGPRRKKAGKFKFFGFSTHTNIADRLAGVAELDWIDATMLTYNFRVMDDPKCGAAMDAWRKPGSGWWP